MEVDTAALAAALIPTIMASVEAVLGEDNAAQVDVIADDLASRLAAVSELFALVEITMFAGRSGQTKRRLYRELVSELASIGVPEVDVTIVILESVPENWGVRGGQPRARWISASRWR